MEKIKKIILVLVCTILLNGCVKMHSTMTINSDKSMIYESEILLSDLITGNGTEETINETERDELLKQGYTIDKIPSTNGYSGIKMTKKFDNIDDLSNNNGSEEVIISNITDDKFDSSKIFNVSKGLIYNTYYAKFKYSSENVTGGSNSMDMFDNDESSTYDFEGSSDLSINAGKTEDVQLYSSAEDSSDDLTTIGADNSLMDMSQYNEMMKLMSEVEFTYVINLPVKALSNNASSTENDGKTLKWSLATDKESSIEFSFQLLNMTNVILICGGAFVLIVIIIVLIISSSKKKKANMVESQKNFEESNTKLVGETTEETVDTAVVNEQPIEEEHTDAPVVEEQPVIEESNQQVEPTTENNSDSNNSEYFNFGDSNNTNNQSM